MVIRASFQGLIVQSGLTWASCNLRNEMERNEMKICSLQNENSVVCEMKICSLQNENSVVCEMRICSFRNDNLLSRCVYSNILIIKCQTSSVSAGKFRLAGMRDVIVAKYKVERRFWATNSKAFRLLYALRPSHLYCC